MTEQIEYLYDVFISYSHEDPEWVEETLLPRLERAGLRICIEERDFLLGASKVGNIEQAVKNCRHTLLILTPAWLSNKWTSFQALLARTQDPDGLERRTIPLILQPCGKLPGFIDLLTSVDFTRPDHRELAWKQLLTGLGKPPQQEPPTLPGPPQWLLKHPFRLPVNFTGREAERKLLSKWLKEDRKRPLMLLRALGGFGKSALIWHWLLNDVTPTEWPQVVWWSFYRNSSFEEFLRETLTYLSQGRRDLIPVDSRQQADELLKRLRETRILLVLNGFERALWAYGVTSAEGDNRWLMIFRFLSLMTIKATYHLGNKEEYKRKCINPLAEYFLESIATLPRVQGKVLMTTRLRPQALEIHSGDLIEGCWEQMLVPMQPADAITFFQAQGIRGSDEDIQQACASYGYHPLSLRVLASGIVSDLQQPGAIAAAHHVNVMDKLVQRRHHVLKQPYEALTSAQRQLLNNIAQRQASISYDELQKMTHNRTRGIIDDELRGLLAWGLVHLDRDKFDLHPIVRLYVKRRMAETQQQLLIARKIIILSVILMFAVAAVTGWWLSRPPASVSIDMFVITRSGTQHEVIKPNAAISAAAKESIRVQVVLPTTGYAPESPFLFTWDTCKTDGRPAGPNTGTIGAPPEWWYVAPDKPGQDCVSVAVSQGDRLLGKGTFFVEVK
jgi:hypothetical protein